jgi:hypothetical protein
VVEGITNNQKTEERALQSRVGIKMRRGPTATFWQQKVSCYGRPSYITLANDSDTHYYGVTLEDTFLDNDTITYT